MSTTQPIRSLEELQQLKNFYFSTETMILFLRQRKTETGTTPCLCKTLCFLYANSAFKASVKAGTILFKSPTIP